MTKLRVVLFDKNCEPCPTNAILVFRENSKSDTVSDEKILFERLKQAMSHGSLRKTARDLGYSAAKWERGHFSIQHDTRDNVIRIRDVYDCVGEPGNILCMVNLYVIDE